MSVANSINNFLHYEFVTIVVDGIYWTLVLGIGFPIAGVIALLRMVYLMVAWTFGIGHQTIEPTSELAVFVTGCDSGFGKELVAPLTAKGFTVFCGCLHKESLQQFKGDSLAIPVQLDVTSDRSVAEAHKVVATWLDKGKRKRHFHALVNNAGVVRVGLIDWVKMSDFKACMDVNFMGMLRCTKEIAIPILKKQAATGSYSDARVINMSSMAGQFLGGDCFTCYGASKHAADAFTNCLRMELGSYGVHVSCINPTFHSTPMSNPDTLTNAINSCWEGLSSTVQEEYGQDFLKAFHTAVWPARFITWRSKNVIDAIEECIVSKVPPTRMLVGMDAKYAFAPLNLLKTGIGISAIRETPAMMK